jgi:hypothetical protein
MTLREQLNQGQEERKERAPDARNRLSKFVTWRWAWLLMVPWQELVSDLRSKGGTSKEHALHAYYTRRSRHESNAQQY